MLQVHLIFYLRPKAFFTHLWSFIAVTRICCFAYIKGWGQIHSKCCRGFRHSFINIFKNDTEFI